MNKPKFDSFWDFYPYYLNEHRHPVCRRLHFIGSALVIGELLWILVTFNWGWLWILPVTGYGYAWVGHFFFEKNRPATFSYPLYSLMGDWVMFWQMLTSRTKNIRGL